MKGRTGSTFSRTKYDASEVETSCYRLVPRLKFIVTQELLYDQADSDFAGLYLQDLQSICSEFKRIELYWNRIVHQNALGVWSSLQPDHDTNKSPRRMQVSPPAEERWQVADLKAETFEDLWYLFSSEDKYKGFSLYQREDWLIDWNQLQLCQF